MPNSWICGCCCDFCGASTASFFACALTHVASQHPVHRLIVDETLGCIDLRGNARSKNLADKVLSLLATFQIPRSKVVTTMTDHASAARLAAKSISTNNSTCVAHELELVVKKAVDVQQQVKVWRSFLLPFPPSICSVAQLIVRKTKRIAKLLHKSNKVKEHSSVCKGLPERNCRSILSPWCVTALQVGFLHRFLRSPKRGGVTRTTCSRGGVTSRVRQPDHFRIHGRWGRCRRSPGRRHRQR